MPRITIKKANDPIEQAKTLQLSKDLAAIAVPNGLFEGSTDKRAQYWEKMFQALVHYKALTGNADPLQKYKFVLHGQDKSLNLGTWCDNQRRLKKKGGLNPEKVERLNVLGFHWKPKSSSWDQSFAILQSYKAKNGGRDPPQSHVCENGLKLGNWCNQQRRQQKRRQLEKDREDRLNSVNFSWNPWQGSYEAHFNALVAYRTENNGKDPGVQYVAKGDGNNPSLNLGYWCKRQKEMYRRGKLSQEKIDQLLALGFGLKFCRKPRGIQVAKANALKKQEEQHHSQMI
jgi:hypothetical protein